MNPLILVERITFKDSVRQPLERTRKCKICEMYQRLSKCDSVRNLIVNCKAGNWGADIPKPIPSFRLLNLSWPLWTLIVKSKRLVKPGVCWDIHRFPRPQMKNLGSKWKESHTIVYHCHQFHLQDLFHNLYESCMSLYRCFESMRHTTPSAWDHTFLNEAACPNSAPSSVISSGSAVV